MANLTKQMSLPWYLESTGALRWSALLEIEIQLRWAFKIVMKSNL